MRNCAWVVAAVVVVATMGCRDDAITPPDTNASSEGLIVSSPMPLASVSGGTGGAIVSQESLAFVSLMPGSAPVGVRASLLNRATGVAQTVTVIEGGFDPVGIAAHVGDTIEVIVTDASGIVVFQAVVAVREPRRPVVVRTNPPRKKTDVPVNMIIQVVFSAPIDSTTLTTESVQLFRGTTPVTGTLRFTDSTRTIAEFRPTFLLAAATSYRLVVSQTIRDVNHLALESRVDAEFTTGNNALANAKLVFTVAPTNTTAGVAITPAVAVAVQDASGNTITYATGAVSIRWGIGISAALSGRTTVNVVNGVATFENLSIEQAGTGYSLVASYLFASPTLTSAPSPTFSVVPAAASKILMGGPSSVEAGLQFSVGVHVSDAFGNSVTNTATDPVTVWLSSNPGGATLAGTLTVPTLFGVATFANLSIDRPGVGYVLKAASGTLSASIELDVWNRGAFAAVSAGGSHTCAVTRDRYAYCWGANANGQVGAGTTIDYASPVIVAPGIVTVSAGASHTCAIADAGLACWGLNDDGQLGDGTKTTRLSPTATVAAYRIAFGVTTGGSHTCGIFSLTPWDYGDTTICWGSNDQGQVGDLLASPIVFAPIAGGSHNCGNDFDVVQSLYCWGSNKNGQLGAAPLNTQFSAKPIRVAQFFGNGALSAGGSHTCASITVRGTGGLYCWGLNDDGQLGDGTTTQRASPVLVNGGPFSSVAAGGAHTCALTAAGAAYCWGANDRGQVGDGTTTMRTSPVLVAGGLTFVSLSAGGSHTCGVTVSGAYCWGANGNGQLGNGATTDSAVPVKVSGQ